jgi:hypothetical protein
VIGSLWLPILYLWIYINYLAFILEEDLSSLTIYMHIRSCCTYISSEIYYQVIKVQHVVPRDLAELYSHSSLVKRAMCICPSQPSEATHLSSRLRLQDEAEDWERLARWWQEADGGDTVMCCAVILIRCKKIVQR